MTRQRPRRRTPNSFASPPTLSLASASTSVDSTDRSARSARSQLSTLATQQSYRMTLRSYHVRWTAELELDEETDAVLDVIRREKDGFSQWAQVIRRPFNHRNATYAMFVEGETYRRDQDVVTAEIVATAHQIIHDFSRLVARAVEEQEWYQPAESLLQCLCTGTDNDAAASCCTRTGLATANLTLRALNLDSLIAVRPDIAIGLQPQSIAIRQDIQPVHTPLTDDPIAYVTSRSDHICTGLSDVPDVTTWFHHLYGEIKGVGGSAVKAELQNDTALRVGLANILRLSDQARRADPAHHLPPSPVMLRIYGLKTVGGDWKLRMMNAQRDSSYNVVDVWSGSMVDPVSHLQFLSLVRHVQKEVPERLRMIGHWLWCLRNTADTTSTRAQAQTLEVGGNGNRGGAGREKNKRRKKDGATGMGTTGSAARGAASHGGHQPQPAVQGVHKIDVASRIEKWRIKSSLLSTRAPSKALSEPVGGFLSTIT